MKRERLTNEKAITLLTLSIAIIILFVLIGLLVSVFVGQQNILYKVKLAKEGYLINEAKEKVEMEIMNLRIEQESKGEILTKENLPKINNDEIDVRDVENFPIEVLCGKYKFNIDEEFNVTYVEDNDGTLVTYTTEPSGYTNENEISILIKITNEKGIKTITYPNGDILKCKSKTEVAIDYTVYKNGSYTFIIVDDEDNEVRKDIFIDKIDRLAPLDFIPTVEIDGSSIEIIENTNDAERDEFNTKSGIDYYEYYLIDKNNETKKYDTNKINGLGGSYKVYVIAYDRAKNKKVSNIVEIEILRANKISASANQYNLVIDGEGDIWSWGYNSLGQLGNGTNTDTSEPIQLNLDIKFKDVSAGSNHALAIDTEGDLWAWAARQ